MATERAYATRHRIILENPVKLVPYPMRTLQRRDLRVLTTEQYQQLLAAAHNISERTLLRVMTEAGLRRGETIALQVGDVDLERGLIRVERRIYEQRDGRTDVDLPKSNRTRTVAINPTLVEELREHLAERTALHPSDYVWVRQNTGTRHTGSTLTQTIYTIAIRAGLQPRKPQPGNGHWVSPHVLRRTGASIAAVNGVPVWITSQQLGHADIRTTQAHYLRLADPGQLAVYGEAFE